MRYLLTGVIGLLTLGIFYSCQKELSVEYSSAAKGSLQSAAGDCLPKTVSGAYVAAKALNDTNYIDVTVTVTSPGPYTIFTDTLHGYSFKATGTFAATGSNTVRLKGSGTPSAAGTDDFTVYFDSSYCDVAVTVLPAGTSGGAATFSLAGSPNACGSFAPFGDYIKDTTLDARHYVSVTVNVTAVGTYAITTNSVNGYFFSASGTFGATGSQTIKLFGNGKPTAAGTDGFTVSGGGSSCTFTITVMATAPAGCSPAVQGTYAAGTAVTAANKVTLTHTYATAGSYTVDAVTVNGYSFGPLTFAAMAGANTITLTAAGTPTAAGSDNFTARFGDGQTCSFSVTVAPGSVVINNDYFPTTQGSYWTYDFQTDTFKVAVNGTQTYSSQTYQKFIYSDAGGTFLTELYRKDASTGFYYQAVDTSTLDYLGLVYTQAKLPVLFLKNTLATGAVWNTDFPATFTGIPTTLRFSFKCTDANATVVWNGKTFTNVYKVTLTYQAKDLSGTFQDIDGPYEYHYAKGVGLIWTDFYVDPLTIRFWQVN